MSLLDEVTPNYSERNFLERNFLERNFLEQNFLEQNFQGGKYARTNDATPIVD